MKKFKVFALLVLVASSSAFVGCSHKEVKHDEVAPPPAPIVEEPVHRTPPVDLGASSSGRSS